MPSFCCQLHSPANMSDGMAFPERLVIAFVMFYSALVFCLPVPSSDEISALYPWWAEKIAIANVQLHELLFVIWIMFYGWRFLLRSILKAGTPTRQAALWLVVLALWCGLVSLSAPLPWLDIGRTLRLLLMAALLLAVVGWTRQMGNFVLGMQILGFMVGTAINLIISFQYPFIVNETMRLSGQNTPGVAMGIAIHLCAWLFHSALDLKVRVFAVLATMLFAFGCAISYSRIGWFAGALGLAAWGYILFFPVQGSALGRLPGRRFMASVLMIVVIFGVFATRSGREISEWIEALVYQKFTISAEQGDG